MVWGLSKKTIASTTAVVEEGLHVQKFAKYVPTMETIFSKSKGILKYDFIFLCDLRACANTNASNDGLAIHVQIVEDCFDGYCSTYVCNMWLFIEPLDVFSVLKFRSNT
mgnify:CR=1 FL=1